MLQMILQHWDYRTKWSLCGNLSLWYKQDPWLRHSIGHLKFKCQSCTLPNLDAYIVFQLLLWFTLTMITLMGSDRSPYLSLRSLNWLENSSDGYWRRLTTFHMKKLCLQTLRTSSSSVLKTMTGIKRSSLTLTYLKYRAWHWANHFYGNSTRALLMEDLSHQVTQVGRDQIITWWLDWKMGK